MDKSPLMYMDRSPPRKTEILKFNSVTHITPYMNGQITPYSWTSQPTLMDGLQFNYLDSTLTS